jgi:hypothetical protein
MSRTGWRLFIGVWACLGLPCLGLNGSLLLADEHPLDDIAAEMGLVVAELGKLSTGEDTQETQKDVVRKLDVLIAELDKQCQACKGGASSGNPTNPLRDSMIVGGPGGIGKLHAPEQTGRSWGQLPPHERDRILQSMSEGFPPHYQAVLERYYIRLAEEQPATKEAEPVAKDKQPAAPQPGPVKLDAPKDGK